ncbi:MAG: elongation factor P [bacterium]|nr:elongation factor P [bacterium]
MISTSDFRNGMAIVVDNELYYIIEFQHVKPGKGGAFVRTKLKKLKSGSCVDKTFRAGERFERAELFQRKVEYLYKVENLYYFMDYETYEEINISEEILNDKILYLKENMEVTFLEYQNKVIDVELPIFINLKVVVTEPGMKGNTVSQAMKPATLETGLTVSVPLFVNIDDAIKVDTRSGLYMERV